MDASRENGGEVHTFLFADLAGYTALTEIHGDAQAAEVVGDFCRAVRSLLGTHDATEVKTIGDAVMLHTGDAAVAVDVARHIVDEVGSRHGFPTVRVGVHTGPAVERDGDWFGAAVNLAARVADSAAERDVLVTATTRDAACPALPDLDFVPAGPKRFKNVAQPVEVFRVVPGAALDVGPSLPTDPVCRMVVDPELAPVTTDTAAAPTTSARRTAARRSWRTRSCTRPRIAPAGSTCSCPTPHASVPCAGWVAPTRAAG